MALVVCVSLTGALLIQPRVGSPAKGCRARLIMTDVPPAPPDDSVTDCLVVGAGISGSTLAHNLNRAGVDVVLAEARDYVGGNVKSHNDDGFIWEEGPNSFATQPSIVRIAYELGIADELVFANEALPPWVNHGGKLHPLPKGQVQGTQDSSSSSSARTACSNLPCSASCFRGRGKSERA